MRGLTRAALVSAAMCTGLWAQPKSAIEFYDTTGSDATARIGWEGPRATGKLFVESPVGTELLNMQNGQMSVNGQVSATAYQGDGSALTGVAAAGHTHTVAQIAPTGITSANIADGTVATVDMQDSAVTSLKIRNGTITDADVSPTAAIAGSKVVPDFDSADIRTKGRLVLLSPAGKSAQVVCFDPAAGDRPGAWTAMVTEPGDTLLASQESVGGGTMQRRTWLMGHVYTSFLATDTLTADVAALPPSDAQLKRDIRSLPDCLAKVEHLQGVQFAFRHESFPDMHLPVEPQIGLVAQEVEEVVPEVVRVNPNGYKGIDYGKLVAVLINAVKEQQSQIDALREEVRGLKAPAE